MGQKWNFALRNHYTQAFEANGLHVQLHQHTERFLLGKIYSCRNLLFSWFETGICCVNVMFFRKRTQGRLNCEFSTLF